MQILKLLWWSFYFLLYLIQVDLRCQHEDLPALQFFWGQLIRLVNPRPGKILLSSLGISTVSRGLLSIAKLGRKRAYKLTVYALNKEGTPALTKPITFVSGLKVLTLIATITASANFLSTWSCLQRYFPLLRALGQALRMCFIVPFLAQSGHDGVSLILRIWKFAGLGIIS